MYTCEGNIKKKNQLLTSTNVKKCVKKLFKNTALDRSHILTVRKTGSENWSCNNTYC